MNREEIGKNFGVILLLEQIYIGAEAISIAS